MSEFATHSGPATLLNESDSQSPSRCQWFRTVVGAFLVSRILIILGGVEFFSLREEVVGTSLFSKKVWNQTFEALTAWDGQWYIAAATRGYGAAGVNPDGQSTAPFFPLLPISMKTLGTLGIPLSAAGLLIGAGAFFVALIMIYKIAWDKGGDVIARRAVWIAAFSPFSIVFSMIYPDGLFMAASAGAFLLVRRDRWIWAALPCVIAALARPNGLVLAISLGYVALRDSNSVSIKIRRLAALSSAFVAVGVWLLMLRSLTGTPFAFISSKAAWEEFAIWDVAPATYRLLTGATTGRPLPAAAILHLALGALGVYVLIVGRKKLDRGWGVFSALVLTGPAILGIVGVARYTVALFPIYVAAACMWEEGSRTERWVLYSAGALLAVLLAGIYSGRLIP